MIGFLIVFPLVLFMSFGLLQLVFYALAVEEISTAAREGARRAALDGTTFADGAGLAHDLVSESKVIQGGVTVAGDRGVENTSITVAGRCKWLLSSGLFGDACDISRTAVVPTEGFVPGIVASS